MLPFVRFRSSTSVVTAIGTLSIVVLQSTTIAADSSSWTQYQADAAHTGHVATVVQPAQIHPLWTKTAGALGQYSLVAGAVTDANHVYLSALNHTGSILGGATYQVLALNSATGDPQWHQDFVPYGYGISAPSVGNGMVYVHQWGHSGTSGGNAAQYPYVFGLDAASGSIRFATSHSGQWSSGSRPTVAGTQVFASGGYYGGLDGYNALTGARSWFSGVNQQYGWIPAADDQRVYVYMGPASASPGPYVGTLYAFNRAGGSLAFTIQNPYDTFTRYNGTVFVGSQNDALTLTNGSGGVEIASFDLLNQNVKWHVAGNFNGNMAIDGGTVFAANGIELDLLNESTGATLNKWFAPAGHSLSGNLALTDNLVFVQTDQATYALDRTTLQSVWSAQVTGDLAIGDDLLLVSNSNSITAFALPEPGIAAPLSASLLLLRRRRPGRIG